MKREPDDKQRDDYLAFVAAVFSILESRLGTPSSNQTGPDRVYGAAQFTYHALNDKGDMQFRVSMPKALVRPTPRYVTIEWRAYSADPKMAADLVLHAYDEIRKEVL